MLAHCLIDDICLLVFKNIYILIILLMCSFIYLCMYFYIFLNSLLVFWRPTLENKGALMCLSSVNIYIYAYFFICFCIECFFNFCI